MRDCEVKGNMTNTRPEKYRPNNVENLPVVLLHGTSGQSGGRIPVFHCRQHPAPLWDHESIEMACGLADSDAAKLPVVSEI
jgi:hypothetical protein